MVLHYRLKYVDVKPMFTVLVGYHHVRAHRKGEAERGGGEEKQGPGHLASKDVTGE